MPPATTCPTHWNSETRERRRGRREERRELFMALKRGGGKIIPTPFSRVKSPRIWRGGPPQNGGGVVLQTAGICGFRGSGFFSNKKRPCGKPGRLGQLRFRI